MLFYNIKKINLFQKFEKVQDTSHYNHKVFLNRLKIARILIVIILVIYFIITGIYIYLRPDSIDIIWKQATDFLKCILLITIGFCFGNSKIK